MSRTLFLWVSVLVVGLGAWLRFDQLDFALPQLARPDEQNIAEAILNHLMLPWELGQLGFNPHFFEYPSLFMYLCAPLFWLYFLLQWLGGTAQLPSDLLTQYTNDPSPFLLFQRALSATFGTLTVAVVIAWAKQVTHSRWTALLAGLSLAVCYLHVRDSHFGVTDIAATFFVTICLWFTTYFKAKGCLKALWGAAVAAGLGASCKYPGALALVAPLVATWNHQTAWKPWLLEKALPLVLVAGAAFVLTSPFSVFDFHGFTSQFLFQVNHLAKGHGLDLGLGLLRHLTFTLPYGLGPISCLLACFTLVWFSIRPHSYRNWKDSEAVSTLPIVLFILTFYLWAGNTRTVFARYMLPLIPVLCLLASLGLQIVWAQSKPYLARPIRQGLVTLLASAIVLPSAWSCWTLNQVLAQPDTRELAASWLLEHTKLNERIGVGMFLSHVVLPSNRHSVWLNPPEDRSLPVNPYGRSFLPPPEFKWVQDRDNPQRWFVNTYAKPEKLREKHIRYLVLTDSPLQLYSSPVHELEEAFKHYQLVATFKGHHITDAKTNYDAIDAWFIPYNPLELPQVKKPGPTIYIFEVNQSS